MCRLVLDAQGSLKARGMLIGKLYIGHSGCGDDHDGIQCRMSHSYPGNRHNGNAVNSCHEHDSGAQT